MATTTEDRQRLVKDQKLATIIENLGLYSDDDGATFRDDFMKPVKVSYRITGCDRNYDFAEITVYFCHMEKCHRAAHTARQAFKLLHPKGSVYKFTKSTVYK